MRATTATLGVILALVALPRPAKVYARANSTSPRLRESIIQQREDPTTQHSIVVGLDLRNRDELGTLLADIQDPNSPNYRRFLTPEQFNSRYAPSPNAEQRLVDHLQANGLKVTRRFPNRLLVAAAGSVAALERTFSVEMYNVSFRGEGHYAAINEPSFPDDLAPHIIGVIGLDDLVARHPHGRAMRPAVAPHAALGGNYSFSPNDLKVFYDDNGSYDGSGQTIVIAGAYKWWDSDVTNFDAQWGLAALPAGSNQLCTGYPAAAGCKIDFSPADNSSEVTMDVESAHGIAPGAKVLNYMAASTSSADFITMYNAIVNDNPGHVVTTSWGSCEAQTPKADQLTDDAIFANANAIGQSWFAASGDDGSRDCGDNEVNVDHPANSPHVMGAGGTGGVCSGGMNQGNPACAGYGSESGWSGSGGGISQQFSRPAFQTGCGVPAGTKRLVPDVAFQADPDTPGIWVLENGGWAIAGGTSDAAPQWAAIFAQLNQRVGGTGLGNPGALLYGMCGTNAFHDITVGSNGDYNAATNYDMVTGLGSPDIARLLGSSATPNVDVVVLPPKPLSVTIGAGATEVDKTLTVTVRNADTSNRTIELDVDATKCPPGSAGTANFGNGQNSILVPAGKTQKATVPLTIHSGAFTSFNFKAPTRCPLVLTASPVGSTDPNPSNNQAVVELNVVDKHDTEQTTKHETTIKSMAPATVTIARGAATATKKLKATVGNADYRPTVEKPGDAITLQASASCSGLTLSPPVCDPITGSATAIVKGGATKTCKFTATVDPAQISTPAKLSPQRCTVTLTATGPSNPEAPPLDPSNNTTELTIDITDKNDF